MTHPNICPVFDVGRHQPPSGPPILFLTMEDLEGHTLRDEVKAHGPMAPASAAVFASQIAAGLEALHDKGIITAI